MSSRQNMLESIMEFGGSPEDLPFWEACHKGRFLVHRCNLCRRYYWPASQCIEHGDQAMEWCDSSGRGELYTYTVLHRALAPSMKDKVPYAVGVVKLDEGPFFHTNIIHCHHSELTVGMRLEAVMQEHESGLTIPLFKPVVQV